MMPVMMQVPNANLSPNASSVISVVVMATFVLLREFQSWQQKKPRNGNGARTAGELPPEYWKLFIQENRQVLQDAMIAKMDEMIEVMRDVRAALPPNNNFGRGRGAGGD